MSASEVVQKTPPRRTSLFKVISASLADDYAYRSSAIISMDHIHQVVEFEVSGDVNIRVETTKGEQLQFRGISLADFEAFVIGDYADNVHVRGELPTLTPSDMPKAIVDGVQTEL